MITEKNKIILAAVAVVVVLVAAAAAELYQANQSAPKPLTFSLSVYPDNGTIMQGDISTVTANVTFQNGASKPLAFSATGGPNGTTYSFANQTETSTQSSAFCSNLTIGVPLYAASDTYTINVTASTADGEMHSATYTLVVVNSEIQVSGTVTWTSHIYISGASIDLIPTDIVFESTSIKQTFQTKVHILTDASGAPLRTGNYSISLPNQQSYRVTFLCLSYPHYIPVERLASGGTESGYFTVDCGVGVNSITANFTG